MLGNSAKHVRAPLIPAVLLVGRRHHW